MIELEDSSNESSVQRRGQSVTRSTNMKHKGIQKCHIGKATIDDGCYRYKYTTNSDITRNITKLREVMDIE